VGFYQAIKSVYKPNGYPVYFCDLGY
jgi:hypothetical protein